MSETIENQKKKKQMRKKNAQKCAISWKSEKCAKNAQNAIKCAENGAQNNVKKKKIVY